MPTFIVKLWLDGYETEEEMTEACEELIDDSLNMTASSLRFKLLTEEQEKEVEKIVWGICQ